MPCKVSIIIAVKNGGQFIAHTLESILAQDYPHIECVVVDGMSSDGTLDVVKSFEPRFAGRLKWVSDDDSGMYQAINRGISLSTGDILGILNSDDFYHRPDSVSTIVKRLEVGDVDAVYGDVRFVRGNDLDNTVRLYSCRGFRNWMFRIGDQPAHPTFFTYRKHFDSLGGYNEEFKIAGDFELMLRFIYRNRLKTAYIPEILVTMRTGGFGNSVENCFTRKNSEILHACRINGVFSCYPMLFLRYFKKITQYLFKG